MSFHVRTEALRACRDTLEAYSADVDRARAYADPYVRVDRAGAGIFQNVVQVNDDVRSALHEVFTRLKEVTHASGLELTEAARWYDATDAAVAGDLDRIYAEVEIEPQETYTRGAATPQDTVPERPDDYVAPSGFPSDSAEGRSGSW